MYCILCNDKNKLTMAAQWPRVMILTSILTFERVLWNLDLDGPDISIHEIDFPLIMNSNDIVA